MFNRALTILIFLACIPLSISSLASNENHKVLVMGDSLSAGYGMDLKDGWVNLLQERINGQYPYRVVNASVSGETSGGGLARLPALLKEHKPTIVILELGGNDGLRGHPVNIMRANLEQMIELSHDADAKVVLLGMQIPPNYGARYTRTFVQTYPELAKEHNLELVPFFLEGVAGDSELMQRDGIHPTADAQVTMLNHVWPALEPLLN
jgi:acyl-CoA thioesterase-1